MYVIARLGFLAGQKHHETHYHDRVLQYHLALPSSCYKQLRDPRASPHEEERQRNKSEWYTQRSKVKTHNSTNRGWLHCFSNCRNLLFENRL